MQRQSNTRRSRSVEWFSLATAALGLAQLLIDLLT